MEATRSLCRFEAGCHVIEAGSGFEVGLLSSERTTASVELAQAVM